MYDISLILQELEVSTILSFYDIPFRKTGDRYDVYCPDPEHYDHHFGNCKMRMDGEYYCFACNKGGSIFDFFMNLFQCSFPRAAEMITEALGGPEAFRTATPYQGSFDEYGLPEPISNEDKDLLGLKKGKSCPKVPKGFSYEKPENGEFRTAYQMFHNEELKGYVIMKKSKEIFSLKSLYNEDREAYDFLVLGKAKEQMIRNLFLLYLNPYNKKAKKDFYRCRDIYLEHGGILETKKKAKSPFRDIPIVTNF